jgi:hypothetical protein
MDLSFKYHPDTQAIFTSEASFNALTKSDTIPRVSTLGTSDINYYSVSTAGTVGGKYPLLSIDGADGN